MGTVSGTGTLNLDTGQTLTLTGNLSVATVNGGGVLQFNSSGNITVSSTISGIGGLVQLGTGTTTLTSPASYSGMTTISAGTLAFDGGVSHFIGGVTSSGSATLLVTTGASLTSDGVVMPTGTWIINGTQTIRTSSTGGAYYLYAKASASTSLVGTCDVGSLTISGGTLSLMTNGLIVQANSSTAEATMIAQIASYVMGGQIISTMATNSTYAVVVASNADLIADNGSSPYFGGLTVDANSILVTWALLGDGDLNGVVNAFDDNIWKAHFSDTNVFSVAAGDFNDDGVVNATDLNIWKANFADSI